MRTLLKYSALIVVMLYSCEGIFWDYGGYSKSNDTEFGYCLLLDKSDTAAWQIWDDGSRHWRSGVFIKYHSKGNVDTLFIEKDDIVIESHICEVEHDNSFILVDQKSLDRIFGKTIYTQQSSYRPNDPGNAYLMEKKLRESNIHQYWIIIKSSNDIFGPMSRDEYLKKRMELKIPQELELNEKKQTYR